MPELPIGLFTFQEAQQAGWSSAELTRAVRRGRLLRLTAGVYLATDQWRPLGKRQRHLRKAESALMTRGPSWAAARRTAALLHGLDLLGDPPPTPQLLRPRMGREKASSRFERVATLPESQVSLAQGLRATSVARTIVDLAREETVRSAVVSL